MIKRTLNFTKAAIDSLPRPASGDETYQDVKISALRLRLSSTGAITWGVYKWNRVNRKPLKVALGPYPSIGIDLARRRALELVAAIDQGRDPVADRKAYFAFPTLGELSQAHATRLEATGHRHPYYLHTLVRLSFGDWLNRRINTISQREIGERHDDVALNRGNVAAARAVKALRTLFRFAELDLGLEIKNTARAIRVKDSKPRGRYMSEQEEAKLKTVLTAEPEFVQDYIALLMLTGARRDNVAGLRWADVNFAERTWTIPRDVAKAGTAITVPLVPTALAILERRKKMQKGEFCFPSRGRKGRLTEVWYMFRRLKARAILLDAGKDWQIDDPIAALELLEDQALHETGLRDLTTHDLRRTLAVRLVGTGASLPIIAAVLGHTNLKTTQQVYALATSRDVRAALERVHA